MSNGRKFLIGNHFFLPGSTTVPDGKLMEEQYDLYGVPLPSAAHRACRKLHLPLWDLYFTGYDYTLESPINVVGFNRARTSSANGRTFYGLYKVTGFGGASASIETLYPL